MSKGLKIGLGILAFGCIIPLITAVLTLRQKPQYHTTSFSQESIFVQFTWQEKPVTNVEHVLLFFEKPSSYITSNGLDVRPPEDTDGYYIFPRGVFYKSEDLLKPVQKILKRQKKDIRTWVVHKGKAFPLEIDLDYKDNLQSIVTSFKGMNIESNKLKKLLVDDPIWQDLKKKLAIFEQDVENGKIDFTPRKRRSDFMTF